jgi:hypothetical protein
MLRRYPVFFVCSLLVGCAGGRAVDHPVAPTTQTAATRPGSDILALVMNALSGRDFTHLIGTRVTFEGGAAPPGGNADLITEEGIHLEVHIIPYHDVRPQAVFWTATVAGVIKAIDTKKKIIVIEAKPEDFVVGDTM